MKVPPVFLDTSSTIYRNDLVVLVMHCPAVAIGRPRYAWVASARSLGPLSDALLQAKEACQQIRLSVDT